ncbi:MAG TPA: riboflavin synthase [Candidatus Gracilibacteria bacterium]
MFTGIIEQVGEIKSIEGNRFTMAHSFTEPFAIGESIACNGVCLTVINPSPQPPSLVREEGDCPPDKGDRPDLSGRGGLIEVEIIEESRNVTTFSNSKIGDKVNLERAAKIGQRNSGHNVTGHVDQVGEILKLEKASDYWLIRVRINPENRKLIVHKGSVAVEGISLTISGVSSSSVLKSPSSQVESENSPWFEVSIISHTWDETNLHTKKEGDKLNVEFDILGKYILQNNP